jgi:replicative superfamily II helicase
MASETSISAPQRDQDRILSAARAKYGDLEAKMCEQFGWTQAKTFQVDGGICQMEGIDVIVHVGTGCGKTAVAAAPFALRQNASRIIIFISPLMALEAEMVSSEP